MKFLLLATVAGVILSLGTGLIENTPQVGLVDTTYYGYPLVWRITKPYDLLIEIRYPSLVVDVVFWVFLIILVFSVIKVKLSPQT